MSCFTIWSRETERMLCFASLRNLSALAAFTPVIPKLSPKISKYALLRCALCCPGDTFVCGKSHLECTCIRARSFECCVCVCVESMTQWSDIILIFWYTTLELRPTSLIRRYSASSFCLAKKKRICPSNVAF